MSRRSADREDETMREIERDAKKKDREGQTDRQTDR